ncbi:MAG: hypothetical protein CM15mP10_1970 [Actinomycetota bacterium]|nr:MAG: hypothetical protein CM15mP10_1970 [Actinomycetota bacterium]
MEFSIWRNDEVIKLSNLYITTSADGTIVAYGEYNGVFKCRVKCYV